MSQYNIILPSKPKIISEDAVSGMYEIDGLYPGYGHTLGNSLRRIILSSLPGAAITSVKIDGVPHEFSTMSGVKEDVITILLNLKKIRFALSTDEPQTASIIVKGPKKITAGDIEVSGQVKVLNKDQHIAEVTDKSTTFRMDIVIERGLGYVSKEIIKKDKLEVGTIALDAIFTPIRRVNYEVEGMRVGDRTDYNRLKITIETDGTITPKEALETSIRTMIDQLKAIVGFKEEGAMSAKGEEENEGKESKEESVDSEALKTRIDGLDLSTRTLNALSGANIRTIGGLARKKKEDLLELEGMGKKGIEEISAILGKFGISLK